MLNELSDEDLLSRLHTFCADARRADVQLILHLIEVEERRLHLTSACSSMFDFCLRRLEMSEGAAFRRINAARLVRKFPSLLAHLEAGKVHLSTLVLLRDHFTDANVDELVEATAGKGKRVIEELIAARAPRPDVPSMIRKLPTVVAAVPSASLMPATLEVPKPAPPAAREQVQPLAPERYKVQLTAIAALREKLERARDLMRHRRPDGDIAASDRASAGRAARAARKGNAREDDASASCRDAKEGIGFERSASPGLCSRR